MSSGSITAEIASRDGGGGGAVARVGPVLANVACVVAVLFTFPVQLFPSLELLEAQCLFRAKFRKREDERFAAVDGDEDVLEMVEVNAGPVETVNPLHDEASPTLRKRTPSADGDRDTDAFDDDLEGQLEDVGLDDDDDTDGGEAVATSEVAGEESKQETVPEAAAARRTMPPKRVAFRFAVVLLVFLAAIAIPDLGALIALLGALTGSILSLIAPAIINRRCPRPDKRRWELPADCAALFVGALGGAFGSYQALMNTLRDNPPVA